MKAVDNVLVICEKNFESLLRKSINNAVEVVDWIIVEDNYNTSEVQEKLQEQNTENEFLICLMIKNREIKTAIIELLDSIQWNNEQIFDIYKTYMAQFARKRYQRIMDANGKNKIDGIVLGSSAGRTAIIEEKLPGRVCNLCQEFQDMYFNACVLEGIIEEYLEVVQDLQYVIIDMSDYNYFSFDSIKANTCEAFLEESGFVCEQRENWNKEKSCEEINQLLEDRWKEGGKEADAIVLEYLFPTIAIHDEEVYKGNEILKGCTKRLADEDINYYTNNPYLPHTYEDMDENTIVFQIDNFEILVQMIKQINPEVTIFLLLTPQYHIMETMGRQVNKEWMQFFYATVAEFQGRYSGIELIDLKGDVRFAGNKDLYQNVSTFNYGGACRFTDYLGEILEQRLGINDVNNAKWLMLKARKLLAAIDEGSITDRTLRQYDYSYLAALLQMLRVMGEGNAFYIQIKSYLEKINIQRLKKQKKIVVGFMANYSSTWIGDGLYHLFEQSQRFEPYVYLLANYNGQADELVREEYKRNLDFFQKKNMRVIQTLDLETGELYAREELAAQPEICIWLTSWLDLFKFPYRLTDFSLATLHTYIPYGFMVAENENANFVQLQYNKVIHNIVWQNFEETKIAVDMAKKYAFVEDSNAVYTGYPKMDAFYEENHISSSEWDTLLNKAGNKFAKKIIYAPHHTMGKNEIVKFSNFDRHYELFLDMAEKYAENTVWIFKPHPQLKYKAIKEGLFADSQEWDAYVEKWKSLKNADVLEGGEYYSLFKDSDAMILDSISFLAEYLYVHKPLLLLHRKEQAFNDFGKVLMGIHYITDAQDEKQIEMFVEDIVLDGADVKKDCREVFFSENMDYHHEYGHLAAENIYAWIERHL